MTDAALRDLLANARTIALVGASPKAYRDANKIMHYLIDGGYTVYPVNPNYQEIDGLKCFPDVQSIPAAIEIVDIFRNPAEVVPVIDDAIAAHAKAIWMQLGVINEEAKRRAEAAGLLVVMDLCILVEHRRLFWWTK